jgi:hypothetical protein
MRVRMHPSRLEGVTIVRTVYVTRGGTVSAEVCVPYAMQVNGAMEARTTRAIIHRRQWEGVTIVRTVYAMPATLAPPAGRASQWL